MTREFGSMDEAFAYMADAEQQANQAISPEQAALDWGSYFVNFDVHSQLVIFGHCWTEDEVRRGERGAMRTMGDDPDQDPESIAELEQTMRGVVDAHRRGYLFGMHYSLVEPDGEIGSTHKSVAWPIDKTLFDAAQAVGWDPARLSMEYLRTLMETYKARNDWAVQVAKRR